MYADAANSKTISADLLAKLAAVEIDDSNTVLVAYKGGAMTLNGKFSSKIKDKKSNLIAGAKFIEAAVAASPNSVEIRFIRLSVQENLPTFVNYRKNIKEDKEFVIKNYKSLSGELKEYVKNFILQSKSFSVSEKQVVNK
ncbi:hypothetical protein H8R25_05700 [Flavobacterium sp. F-392]|uniref:Uncharacterized protein n=1 Tax=Flavobacterium muglaense TaxID=2764716 RepID=A0A923MZC8_9FLAO|nr:hypothetical protein [Flavobacterium muglaense]MBC5843930.1 hypothetical protein [Flavobacterium muglaense]